MASAQLARLVTGRGYEELVKLGKSSRDPKPRRSEGWGCQGSNRRPKRLSGQTLTGCSRLNIFLIVAVRINLHALRTRSSVWGITSSLAESVALPPKSGEALCQISHCAHISPGPVTTKLMGQVNSNGE
jgi:hypothetical protein